MNRIESIQVLRFVAASMVVLGHSASGHFSVGFAGIDIFFVVSGFIISKVVQRRSLAGFVRGRIIRIYPIYWLCLLPMIAIGWDGDWLRLLSSLTLWPVFGEFRRPFLLVGWTLYFEMLFYSAAASVVWKRQALPFLACVYVIALVGGFATGNPLLLFTGNPLVAEFAMGVTIAQLRARRDETAGALAVVAGFALLILWTDNRFGIIENLFLPGAAFRPVVWGVPAALIVWGTLQFEGWIQGRMQRLSRAGDASYSIYLSHPIFLLVAPANPYLKLAFAPIIIGLGFLVHMCIERPVLRTVRDHFKSTDMQPPAATGAAMAPRQGERPT